MTTAELQLVPEASGWPEPLVHEASGCEECLDRGVTGRAAVGEWLVPGNETAQILEARRPAQAIAQTLETAVPARSSAVESVRDGRIGLAEWGDLEGLASLGLTRGVAAPPE